MVYEDNQATITLLINGKSNSERTRHIDIKFFWTHQLLMNEIVTLNYIESGKNTADFFTKPITNAELFERHIKQILQWPGL